MAYINFRDVMIPKTQQPNAVGRPTGIPVNTRGDTRPRNFIKNVQQFPVVKFIIRKQINS
jgi:hypothetical protein